MSATTIDVFVTSPPVVDVTIVSDPVFEVLGVLPTGPRGPQGDPGADSTVPGPQGDPGEGVPTGGTEGQVLAKNSGTDYDTEWVTVPTAEVTQAELDAEAAARAAGDSALDTRVDALEAVDPLTQTEGDARYWQLSTDLATQAELNAEATTRGNADTALDGRLDTLEAVTPVLSVVAGDNVTIDDTDPQNPIISAEAGGGAGVVESVVAGTNVDVDSTDPANPIVSMETLVDADIPASIARDSEVTSAVAAEATARDAAIETHRADTTNVHGITDTSVLETTSGAQAKADAKVTQTITNGVTTTAPSEDAVFDALALKQPLDADLTALAAAGNSAVLAATTASFLTADETKLDGIEAGAQVNPTTEVLQDLVGAMVSGGTETGIAVTYDDTNARLDFVAEVTQAELDLKANDADVVHDTGNETVAGVKTFTSDPIIPDEAYDATAWNGSLEPPTKNAVRDKIESMGGGGSPGLLMESGTESKVTALTALTTFSGDETFYVVEDDDGTPVSRKVTVEDLAAGLASYLGLTPASSSGAASLALAEDTDNGTNKVTVAAPASVASDRTITLPDAAGTANVWKLLFEADGSVTGGTQTSSTWTAGSGLINITQGGSLGYIAWLGTPLPSICYLEARVRATAGADRRIGIILPDTAGATTNAKPCVMLQYDQGSGSLVIQAHNAISVRTLTAQGYTNNTWYTVGMALNGSSVDAYINNTLTSSARYNAFDQTGAVPGLIAFTGTFEIDYFRAWVPTGPTG